MMKNKFLNNLITIALIIICAVIISNINVFPWWSFLIPTLFIGILVQQLNWNIRTFYIGFLAGFILWFGANYYYDVTSNGIILSKVGDLLSLPKILVLVISGIIGGLCTGLALYSGKSILSIKNI